MVDYGHGNISCPLLWPQQIQCEWGTCVNENGYPFCQCNQGWTGRSDLVIINNCHIHFLTVTILWIISLIVTLSACIRSLYIFINHRKMPRKRDSSIHKSRRPGNPRVDMISLKSGKSIGSFSPGNSRIALTTPSFLPCFNVTDSERVAGFSFLSSICFSILAIVKLVGQKIKTRQVIGYDFFSTFVYASASFFFYCAAFSNTWLFGNITAKSGKFRFSGDNVKLTKNRLRVISIINIFSSAIIFLISVFPNNQHVFSGIHFFSKSILIFSFYTTERIFVGAAIKKIKFVAEKARKRSEQGGNAAEKKKIDKLLVSVEKYLVLAKRTTIMLGTLNLILAFFPYLGSMAAYIYPVQTALAALSGHKALSSIPSGKKKKKGSKSDSNSNSLRKSQKGSKNDSSSNSLKSKRSPNTSLSSMPPPMAVSSNTL